MHNPETEQTIFSSNVVLCIQLESFNRNLCFNFVARIVGRMH